MPIVRAIASVIVGYIVLSILIFAMLTAAWVILGADFAFAPGTWETSTSWVAVGVGAGVISAIVGGAVCALIAARGSRAPFVLAGLVLVLGLAMATFATFAEPKERPEIREADATLLEVMQYAEEPKVSIWINPFIGAIGVLLGARLVAGGGRRNH